MIKIKTKKEVNSSGEAGRRIISILALKSENLPKMYTDSDCAVWLNTYKREADLRKTHDWTSRIIAVGQFWSEKEFQEKLTFIKKCGENLKEINDKLEKDRKKWNGEETFCI